MRLVFGRLHRWAGLFTAGFLFLTGITGAVISWDHELDGLLNPHLTQAKAAGPARPALELARETEVRHPQVRVTFVPLSLELGESLQLGVQPRVNPQTGRLYEPGYNQVFLDPATGEELGRREWGAVWPITKETLVSFLYRLHYTLHMPELWGIDRWGHWLLGGIALLWTLDCVVALFVSFPKNQRWQRSFALRWKAGGYRLNFDLHRAFSLWTWALLLILAFTAFSLNLYGEIFYPVMSRISKVTPSAFDQRGRSELHKPVERKADYAGILAAANGEAKRRGWDEPAGSVYYVQRYGIFGVQFFHPGNAHGSGGVGHRELYYDEGGRYLGDRQPWKGTVADIFVQAQFPLHSGRILGIPGRILISIMGVVVAVLSVTGVVIWWRKRKARALSATRISSGKIFGM